jgi:hypothetical protein
LLKHGDACKLLDNLLSAWKKRVSRLHVHVCSPVLSHGACNYVFIPCLLMSRRVHVDLYNSDDWPQNGLLRTSHSKYFFSILQYKLKLKLSWYYVVPVATHEHDPSIINMCWDDGESNSEFIYKHIYAIMIRVILL